MENPRAILDHAILLADHGIIDGGLSPNREPIGMSLLGALAVGFPVSPPLASQQLLGSRNVLAGQRSVPLNLVPVGFVNEPRRERLIDDDAVDAIGRHVGVTPPEHLRERLQ